MQDLLLNEESEESNESDEGIACCFLLCADYFVFSGDARDELMAAAYAAKVKEWPVRKLFHEEGKMELPEVELKSIMAEGRCARVAAHLADSSLSLDRVEYFKAAGSGNMFATVEAYKTKLERAGNAALGDQDIASGVREIIWGYCTGRELSIDRSSGYQRRFETDHGEASEVQQPQQPQ
jgi:hypothetical protein